jgi:hypothetical protein
VTSPIFRSGTVDSTVVPESEDRECPEQPDKNNADTINENNSIKDGLFFIIRYILVPFFLSILSEYLGTKQH